VKSPTNSENPYSNLPVTGPISLVTCRPFNFVCGFSSVFKMSTTPAVPVAKIAAGVIDTCVNFTTLTPVSLIPVVHLDL
jgi:hypothetical protein